MERRLAAILAADVVGYSRLIGADEEGTLRTLGASRAVIDGLVTAHRGRVFGSAGDSFVAEFASPVEAVRCAADIQRDLEGRNADLPEDRRMRFRIGINLGDVIVEGDNLLGDGVNVAARLEALADAGGICLSQPVFDQIKNKLELGYEYLGEQEVKNIAEPVAVYRVLLAPEAAGTVVGGAKPEAEPKGRATKPRWRVPVALAAAVIVLGAAGAAAVWRPWQQPAEPVPALAIAPPLPATPSIAVLPFTNRSDDPSQEYFADGLTEDLITDLSKIGGLLVIARNSVFAYKGKSVQAQQVARELGVRYVLEGSVRRAGDQVRINAQLIDAETGHPLWAERYDGSLSDIFALQDNVTARIVSELAVELTPAEDRAMPAGVAAAAQSPAIDNARSAIANDPNDPQGYLGLAEQLIFLGEPEAAIPIVKRAMRLDPLNPSRYAFALGLAQLGMNRTEQAADTFQKGIEADPKNVHLQFLLAASYGLLDQPAAAAGARENLLALKLELGIPQNFFNGRQFAAWGFKRQSDVDRIADGLRKAGVTQ